MNYIIRIRFLAFSLSFLLLFGCYKEPKPPSCQKIYQEAYREGLIDGNKIRRGTYTPVWALDGYSSIEDYADSRGRLSISINVSGKYGKVCE
jgi:hypothetical protein